MSQGCCRDQKAAQSVSQGHLLGVQRKTIIDRYIMDVPLALELNENIFYYVTRETGQKENQLIGSYNQKSQLKVQNSTSLSKR